MTIQVSLSVGYQRRRPNTLGDRVESRIDSIGLMLAGAAVVIVLLIVILPRLFTWIGSLI